MLIPGFFTIVDFQRDEGQINAHVELNPSHEVYSGHFPGQPVVPGVIQLQMIKEIIERVSEYELLLSHMTFAKFLISINPGIVKELSVQIKYSAEDKHLSFKATIKSEDQVFTKVKGEYNIIKE
ncbi:MAG: hydroxymyristoyl-ACP dehydratase [bacterium]